MQFFMPTIRFDDFSSDFSQKRHIQDLGDKMFQEKGLEGDFKALQRFIPICIFFFLWFPSLKLQKLKT